YETSNELQSGRLVTIALLLYALYRFDELGRYTVHVVTSRISIGDFLHPKPAGPLTSNDVSFDTVPMDDTDEATNAKHIESLIRSAPDLRAAQHHASQLQWLTGDPSTHVKLSLYLHPKEFYPFGVDVSYGLWVARNRALIVSTLEQAMSDPQQPIEAGAVLHMAVGLTSSLDSSYSPCSRNTFNTYEK